MKRLIFRLSSLGDLILSQALLETPYDGETHWVVAKEYESLLEGNPRITRVWAYDRKVARGLGGWLSLLRDIQKQGFDEVIDAHNTLRTRIARLYFFVSSLFYGKTPRWRILRKDRGRRIAYTVFKRLLPLSLRPGHLASRVALLVGGRKSEKPNLRWILASSSKVSGKTENATLPPSTAGIPLRIALAPSSAWRGKEWPTQLFAETLLQLCSQHPRLEIAIIGVPKDAAALALKTALAEKQIPVVDWIGVHSFPVVAERLSTCRLVLGADTGLLHLAESIGVPVVTLFGPTRSDFGFGPLHALSAPIDSPLWCSPCSKDGSLCFRVIDRYRCLRENAPSRVISAVERLLFAENDRQPGLRP
jgi:ADP-heptose:LPS heptosyltransferase